MRCAFRGRGRMRATHDPSRTITGAPRRPSIHARRVLSRRCRKVAEKPHYLKAGHGDPGPAVQTHDPSAEEEGFEGLDWRAQEEIPTWARAAARTRVGASRQYWRIPPGHPSFVASARVPRWCRSGIPSAPREGGVPSPCPSRFPRSARSEDSAVLGSPGASPRGCGARFHGDGPSRADIDPVLAPHPAISAPALASAAAASRCSCWLPSPSPCAVDGIAPMHLHFEHASRQLTSRPDVRLQAQYTSLQTW